MHQLPSRHGFVAVALVLAVAAGCAPAIGVKRIGPQEANFATTANVLNTGRPSAKANQFLYRLNLTELYANNPPSALEILAADLGGRDDRDRLYALAELSFAYGVSSGQRAYTLAAAAYAWEFLFPSDERLRPNRYDPRLRIAMDLYNRGVATGLSAAGGREIDLSARTEPLPWGTLQISVDPEGFTYGGYQLVRFSSLAALETRGLRNRYRRRGIGAPLAAGVEKSGDAATDRWIGPRTRVPVSAVLRFKDVRRGLQSGVMSATIELYDSEETAAVKIDAEQIPLESETTAALAERLEGSPLWDFELAGFRRGDLSLVGATNDTNLFMLHPHHEGRIPVVFVHGTASSPARWAEMTNELMNDPVLDERYQFWFFIYNTGNPIGYSAGRLRQALTKARDDVDPQGKDPALNRMVVIGHSQGGLLTKLTAVSSGTLFWDNFSKTTFEEAELKPETRTMLAQSVFFEPLPFVRRLIFIATPHHGAMAAGNILGGLARRLVSLPGNLTAASVDILRLQPVGALKRARMPTSIDNMSSTNPFLKTLVELPVAPGVTSHSIVAVKKGRGAIDAGNDGVVAYQSAHIEGVESELIVRSSHSTQGEPETIEEVRRILYEHLGAEPVR